MIPDDTIPAVKVSIVIPTFREVENLKKLIPRIASIMSARSEPYEIILVDDNSQDGSDTLVKKYVHEGIPVSLHIRLEERGLGTAVVFGMRKAQGEILVCMDADLSHQPEDLPRILDCFQEANPPEMVIGSRYTQGGKVDQKWSRERRVNSSIATLLSGPLVPAHLSDPMAGFFALHKAVFQRNPYLSPLGYKIGLEIMLKCACSRVKEVPISFLDRHAGKSKLNVHERLAYLEHLSRLYDFRFPRLSSSLKFIVTICLGFCASLFTYLVFLVNQDVNDKTLLLAYLPALGVSALFYVRYLHFNRDFIRALHPYREFFFITLIEFLFVFTLIHHILIPRAMNPLQALIWMTLAGALARFVGRKVFGHDLRGPSQMRELLRRYRYQEDGLRCMICGHREFTFPYIRKFPWLIRCASCALIFAHPQPSNEELSQIYDHEYFNDWGKGRYDQSLGKMKKMTFDQVLPIVQQLHDIQSTIDLGCGLGYVLDQAKEKGWEAFGTELNESAVQDILKRHPNRVFHTTIENLSLKRNFDLITLFEVFEHVRNPATIIQKIKSLMHDDSLLVLTTIDAGSERARLMGGNWYHIHREHLWYFSKHSLFQLFENLDMEVLCLQPARKVYTPRYILSNLKGKSSHPRDARLSQFLLNLLPDFLLDLALPPMHEGIFLIAKKKTAKPRSVSKYFKIDPGLHTEVLE